MPPRISPTLDGRLKLLRIPQSGAYRTQCLICRFSSNAGRPALSRKQLQLSSTTRVQSTLTESSTSSPASNPREELKLALQNLQKNAQNYVNISRLQLALRGLEQAPGQETIRVAVLGTGNQLRTATKIRELVRLLIADPLKEEEEWERQLVESDDNGRPVLLKISPEIPESAVQMQSNRMVRDIQVSSPTLNSHHLEILVLQSEVLGESGNALEEFAERVLVPTIEIPTSSSGRYTPITTPVHMGVVIGDGIMGAASLLRIPGDLDNSTIFAVVDLPGQSQKKDEELPFEVIDVALAKTALASFRQSVDNAMIYEQEWFNSGLPNILEWIKSGTHSPSNTKSLKPPMASLVSSIITDSTAKIQVSETAQLATLLSTKVSGSTLKSLNKDFELWAQRAHKELRDTLETAFEGRRWRKLGWWKLFWRVDDVSMISSDILLQRYLPEAEKEVIYLAGKIEEAGVFKHRPDPTMQNQNWAYKSEDPVETVHALGKVSPGPKFSTLIEREEKDEGPSIKPQPWPLHIPISRTYLLLETVPALQALAQKLVLQTLSTSSVATAFSALIYIADTTTGLYEAGAVAALGIVWSLRRMQTKWEKAREFWESEVREEGRKAIRAVESSVANVLKEDVTKDIENRVEIDAARRAVEKVDAALRKVIDSK